MVSIMNSKESNVTPITIGYVINCEKSYVPNITLKYSFNYKCSAFLNALFGLNGLLCNTVKPLNT